VVESNLSFEPNGWSQLLRIAGAFAVAIAALIPIQAFLFLAFPPPTTAAGYFALFPRHPILGLLDLDLLLSLDNILTVAIYLALFLVVSQTNRSLALLSLAAGLLSITLYLVSREATFSMLSLSRQFAAATDETEKGALLASAQTCLTTFNGSSFDISYVLGGVAIITMSGAALRNPAIGRPTATVGIVTGVLMLLPPTAGKIGLFVSMVSLIPTLAWLVMTARRFFLISKSGSGQNLRQEASGG